MPEQDDRRHRDRDRRPQTLAYNAPDLAHLMTAGTLFPRHHGSHGAHQPESEEREGVVEVYRKRARRQRLRTEPANEQHVGDDHRRLGHVRQNHGPGELQRRYEICLPAMRRNLPALILKPVCRPDFALGLLHSVSQTSGFRSPPPSLPGARSAEARLYAAHG